MSHEPQGRIAEPPRQPYRSSSGRTWPRWWWLAMVVWVAGMLFLMGFGAHDNYEYRSGTPVQATIIDCDPHVPRAGAPTARRGGMTKVNRTPVDCTEWRTLFPPDHSWTFA